MAKIENHNEYKCPYCKKNFKKYGIATHIWRVHTEEGRNFDSNITLKSGKRQIWNKGLDKNDKRVEKYTKNRLSNIENGKTVASFKNKKHTSKTKNQISEKLKECIKIGIHPGWSSQKLISYPEKYFEKILKNNNIAYIKQYHLNDGKKNYFLDFYLLDFKIDLEVDGLQHQHADRIISDQLRDIFVTSLGIKVFRIQWKDPKTIKGKKYLSDKINELLCASPN